MDEQMQDKTRPVLIEEELQSSFLDYAMSVVVSRAIPDVRDGLKPVHRRVLYTMHQLGFFYNRSYHKSVRVVGDVLGKYHPHGDAAVYNTMVGMVQDFSKRYPLLDGQGNWGSVDGDNAAAMRYTEVRMQKISQELLADIEKKTVDFVPNFDDSTVEPVILPSRIPQLLINGTSGIAVGMATLIPPHNLGEVVDACLAILDRPDLPEEELFKLVPAPDFPTGGTICGRGGIIQAYRTGRGSAMVRGVITTEETKKGSALIISELPYQVVKADLIVKIADLVKEKVIEGISNIRDESDKRGMRVVIELRRGEIPEVVINQLYTYTQLQTSVGILMLALLDNRPIVFTLRRLIDEFLAHRREVIFRRSRFDLERANERAHVLEGFIIALQNIDEMVQLIKAARTPDDALSALNNRFGITLAQGKAILDMRLQRLTGLEREKIHAEIVSIRETIAFLQGIISNPDELRREIRKELVECRELYADVRRTRIEAAAGELTDVDLIPDDSVVVTLTRKGYIKRVPLDLYSIQHRGGKGKQGMATLEESEDIVQDIFAARNHDELLFFTNLGRIYNKRVFEIPEASRVAKGRAIVNILPLQEGEHVVKLLCTREFEDRFLVLVTRRGVIKRTKASEFSSVRSTGIRALTLNAGDELAFCALSSGSDSIVLVTAQGNGIRFKEDEVRAMGRQAAGVRGIKLRADDSVKGMEVVQDGQELLFVTSRGYGKRVRAGDFRVAHRGGLGVRAIPTGGRNGEVIGLVLVAAQSSVLLIDAAGKIIRMLPKEIRTMGRQAQGVRLVRLSHDQRLVGIAVVTETEQAESSPDGETAGDAEASSEA
ncbi:MAG: DNA gyrase subunit A [Candidatus Dependentiae bacterium]|nr:DNA gyrase subunit A [Candidatus Dependentiae bacterium]